MPTIIKAIVATFCILLLVTYDFISLCRIIGKEKWVEKIYRSYISTPEYNEDFVFRFIRPLFLTGSMLMYLIIPAELSRIPGFNIIFAPTMFFAFGASFKGILWNPPKKDDDDEDQDKN